MPEVTRVALVGYGYWGPNLARNFDQLPNCELVTCCDLDPKALETMKRLYPHVEATTDYAGVLADQSIEAIALATPARTHYRLAKEALLRGKHLLIEKPLTTDSSEAEELIDIARRQGRVLMVGHTFEYNPAVVKVKELVDSGHLGKLYYIYSTRVNLGRVQRDLNALWSIAPHDISILLYLLEDLPLELSVRGASFLDSNIEDVVFISLVFPEGVIGHVHVSWLDPSKVRRMTLVGSQRMAIYDDVDNAAKVKVYDKGVNWREDPVRGKFQYQLRSGDTHVPEIDLSEPLKIECAHFVDCIQKGTRCLTDGENGLRVVKVLEAAQASLERDGELVKLA